MATLTSRNGCNSLPCPLPKHVCCLPFPSPHTYHTKTKVLCITDFSWKFGRYHCGSSTDRTGKEAVLIILAAIMAVEDSLLEIHHTPWVSTHLFAFRIRAKSPDLYSSRIPKPSRCSSASWLPHKKILKILITWWCRGLADLIPDCKGSQWNPWAPKGSVNGNN